MNKEFPFNDFMNWLFSILIMIIFLFIIFISDYYKNGSDTIREICMFVLGVSSLASIYTTYMLFFKKE